MALWQWVFFQDLLRSYRQWSCKDPSSSYCPCIHSQSLDRMKSIDFWAEGVKGKVHLEVKSIVASA